MMENQILFNNLAQVVQPFWQSAGFWILFILLLALVGGMVYFYFELIFRKSESVATGPSLQIQNILLEYQAIIYNLDKLDIEIEFPEARDLFSEINRKVRRLTAPFKADDEYQEIIASIHQTLDSIKASLAEVRPVEMSKLSVTAVYFAVEAHFSELGGQLSELIGLFEKQSIHKGPGW